jgi:predicted RNase H-like nuclease
VSPSSARRGPDLPYDLLAGVVPCPGGWLVAPGKLVGISLYPEEPAVFPALRDILDHVPGYTAIALAAPVGLPDEATPGGRSCDRDARRLLGWPRLGAVASAPARKLVDDPDSISVADHLSVVTRHALARIAEVDSEIQPYWQRTVYSVHPDLSFHQLNGDQPLQHSKHRQAGVDERRALLLERLQGADRPLEAVIPGVAIHHLLDAVAVLWTARRIAARAVSRIPMDPEWDNTGLRMEYVR